MYRYMIKHRLISLSKKKTELIVKVIVENIIKKKSDIRS